MLMFRSLLVTRWPLLMIDWFSKLHNMRSEVLGAGSNLLITEARAVFSGGSLTT